MTLAKSLHEIEKDDENVLIELGERVSGHLSVDERGNAWWVVVALPYAHRLEEEGAA